MNHRKALLSILLSFALFFSMLAGFGLQVAAEEEAAPVNLVILHTNDVHGRAIGDHGPGKDGFPIESGAIGYARYKTLIDKMKELNEDRVLVLDAGDCTHGTNFATLSQGQSMIRIMNDTGIMAMAPGNHDFNYGQEGLDLNVKEADFPILAANVLKADGSPLLEGHKVFSFGDLKIGVFGLATPETKVKSNPKNTEGLDFADPAESAAKEVEALKAEGVNAIIMLCHLGVDDESTYTSKYVLDRVEGIDLVIDGHSHTLLPEGEVYKDSLIAQTGNFFEHIGAVTLSFVDGKVTEKKSRLIDFAGAQQYEENPEIVSSIDAIEAENERFTSVEVGKLSSDLDGLREHVRTQETNLSDLILDAMLDATQADCAISNGGGIRDSIPAGQITMGHLLTVLPFGNLVTVIKVSGKDIRDALVYGTDAYPETAGKFPQVAGLTYKLVKNGDKYEVQDIMVKGEALDESKEYRLATNDFMAVGGDGYSMFEGKEQVQLEGLIVDILKDFIVKLIGDKGEFSYEADGRIKVEG